MNYVEKILLMADSTCDIPKNIEEMLGIKVLNMPITIDGEGYREREDFDTEGFYKILNENEMLPTTAGINSYEFITEFKNAYDKGYTHIIYISINGKGSSTYASSLTAIDGFFEEYPEAKGKITIVSFDSHSYSLGYGLPLMEATELIKRGKDFEYIKKFLKNRLDHIEVYCTVGTLKFTKKSGRLGSTAAFVGELLGLRPIISFPNGENVVYDKVRGDKAAILKIAELYEKNSGGADYIMLEGEDSFPVNELRETIEKRTGKKPLAVFKAGACVTINAGPQIVGIAFMPKSKESLIS